MADDQNKAVPTPAPAPDWMNQPTEGATSAPAPTPQTTPEPDFSNAADGVISPPEQATTPAPASTPQNTIGPDFSSVHGHRKLSPTSAADAVVRGASKLSTEPIENYTPQGAAEHPILAHLGEVTKGIKELLGGGQYAGKPMGTESGLVNNPVTQAGLTAIDAAPMAAAAEDFASKKIGEAANAVLEHPWATATHPEGSTEAGFASIPGHRELAPPAEDFSDQRDYECRQRHIDDHRDHIAASSAGTVSAATGSIPRNFSMRFVRC